MNASPPPTGACITAPALGSKDRIRVKVSGTGTCATNHPLLTSASDIPGLLEGAHEGLGLGHEFLRHVQRCRALVHVIDGTSPEPMGDFRAINLELELFSPELRDKPQIVAYNKV